MGASRRHTKAIRTLPAGSWTLDQRIDSVRLAYDDRYRRRTMLRDEAGKEFLLDLAKPRLLAAGVVNNDLSRISVFRRICRVVHDGVAFLWRGG